MNEIIERVFVARGADGFYVIAAGAGIGEFIFDGPLQQRNRAESQARDLAKDCVARFDPWGYSS